MDKGNGVGVPSLAAFACEVGEQESEESFAGVSEEHAAATLAIRGNAMTAAYLSLDRPELLVPVKEIIRGVRTPQEREVFKMIARYVKRVPRMAQKFERQQRPSSILIAMPAAAST